MLWSFGFLYRFEVSSIDSYKVTGNFREVSNFNPFIVPSGWFSPFIATASQFVAGNLFVGLSVVGYLMAATPGRCREPTRAFHSWKHRFSRWVSLSPRSQDPQIQVFSPGVRWTPSPPAQMRNAPHTPCNPCYSVKQASFSPEEHWNVGMLNLQKAGHCDKTGDWNL